MKNNIKIFFKSLISNNACIEGGRKKPWYAAIIIFFISTIVALVPTFVRSIKAKGDDIFSSHSYGLREASYAFSEHLDETGTVFTIEKSPVDGETHRLAMSGTTYSNTFTYQPAKVHFEYFAEEDENFAEHYKSILEYKETYVIFTSTNFYYHIYNQYTEQWLEPVACKNAYKYIEEGFTINSLLDKEGKTLTDNIKDTWTNWKGFYRDAYNYDRLTILWQQCLLIGGIDIVITALMGLMVFILTRGKNNPYRHFTFWEGQKIAYWSVITPAILTCALGFLLSNSFGQVLFPLLVGIRIMWLSMKSLKPDGSGYGAN